MNLTLSETPKTDFSLRCPVCFSSGFCQACGGQIRDFPGALRSPDYDGDGLYESNLHCDWTIIADEDHVVDFFLYELDLGPDCTDIIFLRVSNNNNKKQRENPLDSRCPLDNNMPL